MQLKEVLVQQAGMPKPLAVEVRPADDGIQLVFSLSRQQVDEYSGSIRTVTFEHHEIHDGDHFFIQDVVDLSLNNVLDMQFTTPDTDGMRRLAERAQDVDAVLIRPGDRVRFARFGCGGVVVFFAHRISSHSHLAISHCSFHVSITPLSVAKCVSIVASS